MRYLNILTLILFLLAVQNSKAQYCDARATDPGSDYISYVQLEDIVNDSDSRGYSDFTSMSARIYIGGTYTLYAVNASHHTNNKLKAWIDWNGDETFDNDTEVVEFDYPARALSVLGNATFTVPDDAKLGATRLRIILTDFDDPEPCGDFYYGEVEDYTVVIGASNVAPVADFFAHETNPFVNNVVYLKDLSSALPSEFTWSFEPATVTYLNNTDANSEDPVVEFDAAGQYNVTLTVKNAHGENTVTKSAYITAKAYDSPFGLTGTTEGNRVSLAWNAPIFESFESYDNFSLEFEPWTQYDGDGKATLEFTGLSFPNMGYQGSFIVFNPNKTQPAVEGAPAHSGSKYLACFRCVGEFNDDWLISPKFTAGNNDAITFFARTLADVYAMDEFKVLVSETDASPSSFRVISGDNSVTAPLDWQKFSYDLSAYNGKEIRVAIQCVSSYALALCLDDIMILRGDGSVRFKQDFEGAEEDDVDPNTTYTHINNIRIADAPIAGQVRMPAELSYTPSRYLQGFKIYRNDTEIGTTNTSWDTKFIDKDVPDGDHVYAITATYITPDCESAYSNKLDITVDNSLPELNVTVNDKEFVSGERYTTQGSTSIGESTDFVIKVNNIGNSQALEVNNVTIAGDNFTIKSKPEQPVAAGESADIIITYSPTEQGGDVATISFETNDNNEGTFNMELKATTGAIWTWMIYLYEDGTGLNGFKDINELEAVGSIPDKVNFVVLYDSDIDEQDGIYLIKRDPDGNNQTMISPIVDKSMGMDFDMNNWETLDEFMQYTHLNYPAEHYALTVWDHGSGIFRKSANNFVTKGAVGEMKLWEMDDALSNFKETTGKKLDIMSFDLCLLGQIETVYQLKDYADYVIASEKTEPGDGWDYENSFVHMYNNPEISAAEISAKIVEAYTLSYENGEAQQDGGGTTQSFTSVDGMETHLIPALNTFSEKLIVACSEHKEAIKEARLATWYSDGIAAHVDLGHFAKLIKTNVNLPEDLRNSADGVIEALKKSVLLNMYTKEINAPTTGLKIWFPLHYKVENEYPYYTEGNLNYLTFSETKWDEFLEIFENPVANGKPIVEFTASKTEVQMQEKLMLVDNSLGNPIIEDREWTVTPSEGFEYTNGTTNLSKRPVLSFSRPGTYAVALKVTNSVGEKTLKKTGFITVSVPTDLPAPQLSHEKSTGGVTLNWLASADLKSTLMQGFENMSTFDWIVKTSKTFELSDLKNNPSGTVTWGFTDKTSYNGEGQQYIHSGKYSMSIGYTSKDLSWLITPEVTIQEDDDLSFWTWYKNGMVANDGKVYYTKFYVAVIEGSTVNKVIEWNAEDVKSNVYESAVNVDLADYEGKTVRVAFIYEYNDGFQMAIDDVVIGAPTSSRMVNNQTRSFTSSGFEIYRNDELIHTVTDPTVLTYTDEGLATGTYYYKIVELFTNPDFSGPESNEIEVTFVSTAIDGVSDNINIDVYPNPAKDQLNIKADIVGKFNVTLYNLAGSAVMNLGDVELQYGAKINLKSFEPGVYLLHLNNNEYKITRKIVLK